MLVEYDHRLISIFKIGQSFLNLGDQHCFLLRPNELAGEQTIAVLCTTESSQRSVLLFDSRAPATQKAFSVDAFREFSIPVHRQSNAYTLFLLNRLIGLDFHA